MSFRDDQNAYVTESEAQALAKVDEGKTSVQKLAEYKADKLIGGYKAIEEALDVLVAEHAAQIKPLKEKMQEILGALGIKMNAEGVQNYKSEYGTSYFTTIKKTKMLDRVAFHQWVHDKWEDRRDCLTAHVAKEEVVKHLEYMRGDARDEKDVEIPGLEIEDYTSVHIRKA
jgi:hypothetical protein